MGGGFEKLMSFRERYASLVYSFIAYDIIERDPEPLGKASLHLFRAGGKMFRPLVVLAAARMLGGPRAEWRSLPLAAAVEIFHTFSLIHDDIMDEDTMRRGVPSVHVEYGIPMAILAGDYLHALSYKAILKAQDRGLPGGYALQALSTLVMAAERVSKGQAYDMLNEKRVDVSFHDYIDTIYLKTAGLIEASAELGAIGALAEPDVRKTLASYGRSVGLAFQIRDDILGVFGDPKLTGKPVGSDLYRSKKTVLLLYAYEKADGKDKEILRDIMEGRVDESKVEVAVRIIRETGALSYAENLAKQYSTAAMTVLEDLRKLGIVADEEGYEILAQLAQYAVERVK